MSKCVDCHQDEGIKTVYLFDSEHEGDKALMCESCYSIHEENGDWVA